MEQIWGTGSAVRNEDLSVLSFRTEVCVWNTEEKSFMLEKKFGGLKS